MTSVVRITFALFGITESWVLNKSLLLVLSTSRQKQYAAQSELYQTENKFRQKR